MKLGIVEHIDCAHRLPGHERCGSVHGHTYKIELVIEGQVKGGMVVDFTDLRKILRAALDRYDHQSLNDFLAYPSVENVCQMIGEELSRTLTFPFSLRVWEGKGKWAELSASPP